MMSKTKKLTSVLLAVVMILSLSISAFAVSGNSGSITIHGIAGEQYSIYRLFDLTYSTHRDQEGDQVTSYSYKAVSTWEAFLRDYSLPGEYRKLFTLDANGYLSTDSAIFQYETDSEAAADFAREALSFAAGEDTIDPLNTKTADAYGTVEFDDLDLGLYLVSSSLGTICMLTNTDPDGVVNEKNGEPVISKYLEDMDYDESFADHTESDNNDTLEYALVVENVANVSNLVIHDYMDEQLDSGTIQIVSVTLHRDAQDTTGTKLKENRNYTYTQDGTCSIEDCGLDGCTFELKVNQDVVDGLPEDAYIVVIYTVKLVEDSDDYVDLVDEIDNQASVSYGMARVSLRAVTEDYSFGFNVFKYTDLTQFTGEGHYVMTVPAYNDGLSSSGINPLYLVLTDADGSVVEYGIFESVTVPDLENTYRVTNWTTEFSKASSVIEPDGMYTAENPVTYTFYYDGRFPSYEHVYLTKSDGTPGETISQSSVNETVSLAGDIKIALPNAEFILSKTDGANTYYAQFELDHNGIYMLSGWSTEENATVLKSGTDGMIRVEGLHDATYTLTEKKAPDGYNLLGSPVEVTISATGQIIVNGDLVGSKTVNVLNNAGSELPSTGGMGTTVFYVVGALLILAAAVILIVRRRIHTD